MTLCGTFEGHFNLVRSHVIEWLDPRVFFSPETMSFSASSPHLSLILLTSVLSRAVFSNWFISFLGIRYIYSKDRQGLPASIPPCGIFSFPIVSQWKCVSVFLLKRESVVLHLLSHRMIITLCTATGYFTSNIPLSITICQIFFPHLYLLTGRLAAALLMALVSSGVMKKLILVILSVDM